MNDITDAINRVAGFINRPVRLMEVCGTHTVAIFKHGIRSLLPEGIKLLSGPGCPVCVTSAKDVETAIVLSHFDSVIFTTFGDMMRVPGNKRNLFDAKSEGGTVRIVYSPLDALRLAGEHRDKKIVFFATGFETTSPSVAGTILEAEQNGMDNFYIYSAHKLVPPALKALLDSGDTHIDGFILPGHVSTIIGVRPYHFLASEYRKPSVITGFDARDILEGILLLLQQIASEKAVVRNQYARVVKEQGNPRAVALVEEFFEPADVAWRGIGIIPKSGLRLKQQYRHRDVQSVLSVNVPDVAEPKACLCGDVLKGVKTPNECPLFGTACIPEKPVGACMVSTEGSCAAYYKYQ